MIHQEQTRSVLLPCPSVAIFTSIQPSIPWQLTLRMHSPTLAIIPSQGGPSFPSRYRKQGRVKIRPCSNPLTRSRTLPCMHRRACETLKNNRFKAAVWTTNVATPFTHRTPKLHDQYCLTCCCTLFYCIFSYSSWTKVSIAGKQAFVTYATHHYTSLEKSNALIHTVPTYTFR